MRFIKYFMGDNNDILDNGIHPKKDDIEFINFIGQAACHDETRVKLAKEVDTKFKKYQIEKYGSYTFSQCPGMLDYSRMGYIIPAWTNFEFLFNSAGIEIYDGTSDSRTRTRLEKRGFDPQIFDGAVKNDDGSQVGIYNIQAPWHIRCKPGIHIAIMPAFYHSNMLDDFHILPGVIDYGNGFHTINFLTGPKRYGKFKISMGEPLFHLIPFKNATLTASYGLVDNYKNVYREDEFFGKIKSFYRKFYCDKRKYFLRKEMGDK